VEAVLFDLGAVLIDRNPRYLYRPLFKGDDVAMERFLEEIVPNWWNREIDAGKPFADAVAERIREFPEHAQMISLWKDRWEAMLQDAIHDSVGILAKLRSRGYRLCALTNWSAETFPLARQRFGFLEWFEDIVVSGEVGLAKPDPRIFALTIDRCRLNPPHTLFVDDSLHNVDAGRNAGLHALHFHSPAGLRSDLTRMGLL